MHHLIEPIRRIRTAHRRRHEILMLARMNCCDRDDSKRKSLLLRYIDLTYSLLYWNELSSLYYAQGIDQRGTRVARDYLSYNKFRTLRNSKNKARRPSSTLSYACLLQDKLLFERYFNAGNLPVPKSLGEIDPGGSGRFKDTSVTDFCTWGYQFFCDRELFIKPRFGIKGKGVFKVQFSQNNLILVNGKETSRRQLLQRITEPSLVQEVIDQHHATAQLHPPSLNTLRVITYVGKTGVEVFLSYLRMGRGGEIADNNTKQRAITRVDQNTGQLHEWGYEISGQSSVRTTHHRDTDVQFKNVLVPRFSECLDVAKAAHRWIPQYFSVGWDIAITATGPLLLEGNDDWGATTAMWAMPDFAESFYDLFGDRDS